jgi:hypothetical protein
LKKKLVAFIFVILLSFNFLTNYLVIHPKSCSIDVQFDSCMLPVESKKTQKDVSWSKEHACIYIYLQRWRLMATNILEWLKSTLTGPAQMAIRYILALTFYFCCQRWRVLNRRIDATNIEGFFFFNFIV